MKRIVGKCFSAFLATTVTAFAAVADELPLGWTGEQMDSAGALVRADDGELVYAYTAADTSLTVNGVTFAPWGNGDGPNNANVTLAYPAGVSYHARKTDGNDEGASGDYGTLLKTVYTYNSLGDYSLTFNNLEAGKRYLAQIIVHYNNGNPVLTVKDTSVTVKPYVPYPPDQWKYGGSLVCVFVAEGSSQTFTLTYSNETPCTFNAVQLRCLDAAPVETDPAIGTATVKAKGAKATVSLANVKLGTDDKCVAATKYSVAYKLNGGAAVTALENQTASAVDFEITGLADGEYAGEVWITTDTPKTSASKAIDFKINTSAPAAGWTAEPMSAEEDAIITDGEFVCGYARTWGGGTYTVNGVTFTAFQDGGDFRNESKNPHVSVSSSNFDWSNDLGNEGVPGDLGEILKNGFAGWKLTGEVTFTLKGLEKGESYLVQMIIHRNGQSYTVTETETEKSIKVGGSGWTYGGSLVGTFVADDTTHAFTLDYGGEFVLNAIQVRKIDGLTPSKSEPVIGSVTATVANRSTTATISLADIQLGTDDEGVAATKYAVVYSLNGATEVTNLVAQTASSAEFAINGLADGDYTCAVKIVTDKGKASAAKNAAFTIDTALHPVAPAIGSVKAVLSGSKATIKLADIVLGTNAEGSEDAASYTLSYTLDGAETTVGSGLTGAATQFVLTGLAEGSHTCNVKIVTDKNREATGSVTFKIVPMPVGTDVLKISEICPRPDAFDPNGKESGWIELWNSGESDIDLAEYEIVRVNRGKELKTKGTPLASRIVPAGGYTLIYTSEEYGNVDSGKVKIYDNDVMVYPVKVNPKKFPLVALYKGDTLLEQFVVPVDLPDNQSFAPAAGGLFPEFAGNAGGTELTDKWHIQDSAAVTRVILPTITPGAVNNRTGEIPYGPNAGPLYGIKHGLSDWKPFPQAKEGVPYPVTMAINPFSLAEGDEIVSVKLVYRIGYARADLYEAGNEKYASVEMTKGELDAEQGQLWTAEIPFKQESGDNEGILTFKAGRLLRWAAQVTDKSGNMWRTPSFRNPDDGYEWYGTIVEPTADQLSATLPTWHLFVARQGTYDMDWQHDSGMVTPNWPYGVRCGIYDSQTSNYYDNVRIDVRGNTTAEFPQMAKKSHGLRFSKVHPLQCTDPFSGERIEVRKTSLLAEYQDPSNLRSDLSMYLRRKSGQEVPFGYPVRLQLNGEFFQLAHHSNRFTDEYLTDYLGLDEHGCVFKNIGTVGGNKNTGLKSGDPPWGVPVIPEYWTVDQAKAVFDTFKDPIAGDTQYVNNNHRLPNSSTNGVVRLYDLPAWFNFLALSRITQECDDDTSTLNVYYDRNGNGAWRPLAYDLHQSFGVFWADTDPNKNRDGLITVDDNRKCHPFHGGLHAPENSQMGNRAYEGIYQTAKFRRLLVRRLRTLMDEILKEPGTPKEETPFWKDYVVPMYNAMKADNDLDRKKKPINVSCPLYVWPGSTPLTFEQAVDDLWDNYIVPRRNHFYVTHSITNTAKQIGYGTDLNAGIPLAQSPITDLKAGFSVEAIEGGVVVRNLNAETVDMSGWKLSGAVSYTFPAGSVIDQAFGDQPGEVFVVTDRTNYIARLEAAHVALTDQVILGNAVKGVGDACGLKDANGELVFSSIDIPEENTFYYTGAHEGDIVIDSSVWPDVTNECTVIFDNASVNGRLILANDIRVALVLSNDTVNTIKTIEGPGAHLRLAGAEGELKLEGAGTLVSVSNLVVKSGTLSVKTTSIAAADEGNKTKVIEVLGHVKQTGGVIDVDIGLETTNQVCGIYLKNKNNNEDDIYAEFSGGEFKATVGGTKSAAIYVNKGSVDTKFEDDFSANVTLVGPEPRFVNSAGDIKFRNGSFAVTGTVDAVSARVFKTNKKISVTDGLFQIEVTGGGSEIFSTSIDPEDPKTSSVTFSGGTFELSADDDCVSADTLVQIDGGLFYAVSAANDVFDSNGNMTINGGTIMAYALADGHEAFDVDAEASGNHGTLTVNGGTIFATGGADAKWPVKVVSGTGVVLFVEEGLDADGYSGKYLSLAGSGSITYTAKFPAMSGNCAIFATCPGFGGTPTLSGAAPTSGDMEFHDLYVVEEQASNQEYLRVYEVYGSTTGTGDEGEYIVLTNVSDKVVQLEGFRLTSAKDDGKSAPKVNLTLAAGTVPAYGCVKLTQADYTGMGWEKITNGKIVMQLTTSASEAVQTARSDFGLFEDTDGKGASLIAKRFDNKTPLAATTDDWRSSSSEPPAPPVDDPDAPVIGGGDISDPIVVTSDKVTIKISNAGIGFTYGYKKSVTLEGLATADPEWLAAPVDEAGVLAIEIAKDPEEPVCFYQIVVK